MLDWIPKLMILLGAALMVSNIWGFHKFIKAQKNVLSEGRKEDTTWTQMAFSLLHFFLIGYVIMLFQRRPGFVLAGILLGGSVFVSIVLTLLFRLTHTVRDRSLALSEVLVGVIDARDPNLNGHSIYVRNLTMLLYQYLPEKQKKEINPVSLEYAALMHDLGKLGVPESILNKPGKLNDDEWKVMRNHPDIGVNILRPMETFDSIADWIKYHHERIDGKGYHGLSGDEIPFPARLIAVCDTYSAITMRRSYKPPRSYEEAVEIMKEVRGTQLDAELTDLFLTIPRGDVEACAPANADIELAAYSA